MRFLLKGRLCATRCDDFRDPLSKVTVRLSRLSGEEGGAAPATQAKAYAIISPEEVYQKRARLVAEVKTDEDGYFYAEIEEGGYQGQPLELDVVQRLGRGVRNLGASAEIVLHLGVVQPFWRESADCYLAAWAQCLPRHVWCMVRGHSGRRELVGHVRESISGQYLAGVRVRACKLEGVVQELGEARTDSLGRFSIRCGVDELRLLRTAAAGYPESVVFFEVEGPQSGQSWQVTRSSWCGSPQTCAVSSVVCVDLDVDKGLVIGSTGSAQSLREGVLG